MPDETILCISPRMWNSLWRDTQQIMSRLSASNRVVFVEPQRDPDMSYVSDLRRRWKKIGKLAVESPAQNLEVVSTPPALPYFRRHLPRFVLSVVVPIVVTINYHMMRWHLNRVVQTLGIGKPILWLYSPRQLDLIGKFDEKLSCYFNYDELSDFEGNERIRELLLKYDELICQRVDIVFTTSRSQFRRRKPINSHTYFVPNGVDYPLFSRALDPATRIPSEVEDLKRPLVGYVGWLGPHADVELLVSLSRAYPELSFVFVGPYLEQADKHWRELKSQPNVLFTGKRKRQELPGYLKAFDAVLIPDIVATHRLAAYPLKLHEYLAAGRSILATNLPELEPYQSVLRIANTRKDFVRMLPEAIADNSADRIRERTALASDNSWDQRVAAISNLIEVHLSGDSTKLETTSRQQNYQPMPL